MIKDKFTRRQFLHLAAGSAAGAVLTACASQPVPEPTVAPKQEEAAAPEPTAAPKEEEAAAPEPTAAPKEEEVAAAPAASSKYKEAPMLADLVAAGELPVIDERLPKDPRVITPV